MSPHSNKGERQRTVAGTVRSAGPSWLRQILNGEEGHDDSKESGDGSCDSDLGLYQSVSTVYYPAGAADFRSGSTPLICILYYSEKGQTRWGPGERAAPSEVIRESTPASGNHKFPDPKAPVSDRMNIVGLLVPRIRLNQWLKNQMKDDNIVSGP